MTARVLVVDDEEKMAGAIALALGRAGYACSPGPPLAGLRGTLQDTLDEAARRRLQATLETHGGRRAEAAQELGIDRTTLYRLMKRLGI